MRIKPKREPTRIITIELTVKEASMLESDLYVYDNTGFALNPTTNKFLELLKSALKRIKR